MDAAICGAETRSVDRRNRWKSHMVRPAKITRPRTEKIRSPPGSFAKTRMTPKMISPTSAKNENRPIADRSRRVA